jgi:adenylate kinase
MRKRITLVFMGPQGSGKGTQAQLYARRHGFAVISTGNLLRKEALENTERGRQIAGAMNSGDLISDDLTMEVLDSHVRLLPDSSNVILDGLPRTLTQAKLLDSLLMVTAVVFITLSEEESIRRISGRLQCPNGHIFNKYSARPRIAGVCDQDGLSLHQREDDSEQAVRKRLQLHKKSVANIMEFYRVQNKLITINGNASIDSVSDAVRKALQPYVSV